MKNRTDIREACIWALWDALARFTRDGEAA